MELEASDGEVEQNLPLDTVKEGGEGDFQAEVRTQALYLSVGKCISTFNLNHVR